jgi:outer membrane protein
MNRPLSVLLLSLLWTGAASAKDLVGVFEDARQNDPQIRAADANRLAQRETKPQALAALLPQISATAARTKQLQDGSQSQLSFDPIGGGFVSIPTNFTSDGTTKQWAFSLRQNIFSWSNWMTLKAASSEVAQAEANYQAAEQNLILRVSQAYFNVLSAQDNLDAQQASLEAISRQLDQANKRFEVGLIAITDVQEAKAARDNAAAAVIAAKRTLATSGDQLSEITGQKYDSLSKPGVDMPLKNPEPASEDRWVEVSLEQNLTLIASRLAADTARDNVRVAVGGHLPTVDFVASRTHTNSDLGEAFGLVAFPLPSSITNKQYSFQLNVPIFSGGATQSRVRQSQYEWIAAKETVVQNSRATERQARDAYLGVISGIARVQALRQALESSDTALKATEAGYEVGTRTAVDVLNARRTLVQAQTDFAVSRYDYILSIIQLRLAAGTLDRQELTEINQWLGASAPTTPAAPLVPTTPPPTPSTTNPAQPGAPNPNTPVPTTPVPPR